jgi:hypothetical protein
MPILSKLAWPWAARKIESAADTAPVYLIMVQPALVARDIELTIADYAPRARTIIAQTPMAAIRAVDLVEQMAAAFLAMDPEHAETCALCDAVRVRGGRVILVGDAAERAAKPMEPPAWSVLVRPFSTEAVMASLTEAAQWQGAA